MKGRLSSLLVDDVDVLIIWSRYCGLVERHVWSRSWDPRALAFLISQGSSVSHQSSLVLDRRWCVRRDSSLCIILSYLSLTILILITGPRVTYLPLAQEALQLPLLTTNAPRRSHPRKCLFNVPITFTSDVCYVGTLESSKPSIK